MIGLVSAVSDISPPAATRCPGRSDDLPGPTITPDRVRASRVDRRVSELEVARGHPALGSVRGANQSPPAGRLDQGQLALDLFQLGGTRCGRGVDDDLAQD